MAMASISLVKKKIFSKPRSTSGCLTCKYRRVKCDETQPECLRCIRFKTNCGGYQTGSTKVSQKLTKSRLHLIPILPYTSNRARVRFLQPSSAIPFQSDLEAHYFKGFQEQFVHELTGPFNSSLWSQIMLQACHSDSCILEAVVALAALRMSLSTVQKSTIAQGDDIPAQHYRFALLQYGKAIRNMRKSLVPSNIGNDIRKVLICCLLVFCFEAFQGNHTVAISHAKSGCRLLQDCLTTKTFAFSYTEGISYTGYTVIEDDLLRAFMRLELQIMTYTASGPIEVHRIASKYGGSEVADMPEVFSDFNEANRYWELIMWRNHHFIHSAIATANVDTENCLSTSADQTSKVHTGIDSLLQNFYCSYHFPILQTEYSLYSTEISRWQSAFKPFLSPINGCIQSGAAILQMPSISTQITLDLLTECNGISQQHLDKFYNILYLAKSCILNAEQEIFCMDLGIIASLNVVIGNCHISALQHEACQILESTIRREGLWNSMDVQIKARSSV